MTAWRSALACDPERIHMLRQVDPNNEELATLALEVRPDTAEVWFWNGDLRPDMRADYYKTGLNLDPSDGKRWILLGTMLEHIDPEQAMQAFLQGCYNGDPGVNGCVNAGRIAEKLGDTQTAIRYYRLSQWEKSQQKADELERQIINQANP